MFANSGDIRGVWKASPCNELTELWALSFALPGILCFFLSLLGGLKSFEPGSEGPTTGDLENRLVSFLSLLIGCVGSRLRGANTGYVCSFLRPDGLGPAPSFGPIGIFPAPSGAFPLAGEMFFLS